MAENYFGPANDLYVTETERQEGVVDGDCLNNDEDLEQVEEEIETRCGLGTCRPGILQRCNNPTFLLCCLCVYTLVHGFAVNGINNVNTTSYERRFDLTSSSVGWISSSFDISAAICGVIIGFYGNRRKKGRILTGAFILSSLGSMCMWLPHFITPRYEWGQGQSHLCSATEISTQCSEGDWTLSSFLTLLLIGQLMHGLGGSTLITVGYSFIDDSVTAATSPVYISMIGLCQMLGPMLGFIVGGALLDIYVDFERMPESQWELTPTDPRWVGAWWVGFFISSVLMFIFALPFILFGAELPTAKNVRETRVSETHNDGESKRLDGTHSIRQFPILLCRLLRNPAFLCVAFAGAFMGLVTISMATFLPKYIQNIYGTTASSAATYAGLLVIPGAALGQMFGGFVIRRWRLKVQSILKFLIAVVTLSMISKACFFINCDIVVWNTNITDSEPVTSLSYEECSASCHCDDSVYQVVCDREGRKYYSPCLAGCQYEISSKMYSDCQCVSSGANVTSVTIENCIPSTCNSLLYIFLFMIFLSAFFVSSSTVPALTVVLRCAHENERTFALGLLNFIARVIGTIPGPILYGSVIDSTCRKWGKKCGHNTSCWKYDNARMGEYLAFLGMGFTGIATVFFFLSYKLYKPPTPMKKETTAEKESTGVNDLDSPVGICSLPEITEDTKL
ncbi:solute carrier organic anion transporter family member 4C1-like isoform X2 [Mercenaria mercenaria]|uniref:solute carrier organic anion transporter family member 4C1-like isoform X2 n=1 Tax=Mercenaria mercenaria TaxID=6596 RepID=UPI00234F3895|nr:solute carrier organic anion transporter family member 4C1-like isoform X2 [Mercenaria mercenaria]